MPQAHAGGNQAKDNTFADSAGAPGNVTGGSLDIENYCMLRFFLTLLLSWPQPTKLTGGRYLVAFYDKII